MRKFAVLFTTMLMAATMMVAVPVASAEHPDTDDAERTFLDGAPWSGDPEDPERDNPICDGANDDGEYLSMDWEFWVCKPDPGIPEVPGSGGFYWEPVEPEDQGYPDDGGDVTWAKKWAPVSIPNNPGVVMRLAPRTEWLNPTGGPNGPLAHPTPGPVSPVCPNVTGGCKLKAGADIHLRRNGAPFQLNTTWFNQALQLYVYNATTKVWDLKQDTGWRMNSCGTPPCYSSKMVSTTNYGTAPYGAAWYFVRGWARTWNGTAWSPSVYTQPATGVWDAKPGDSTMKVKKPKKLPALHNPRKGDAVQSPTGPA